MSGPMRDTWQAVGFGSQMKGSLAFIVYSNANKDSMLTSSVNSTFPWKHTDRYCQMSLPRLVSRPAITNQRTLPIRA